MRCAPARPVRALCEPVAQLLSKNMTCARPRCNARPSKHFLHTSHCTLHTSHFTLLHARKHTVREKSLARKTIGRRKLAHTEAWDTFTQKSLYTVLCTIKLEQSTSQYYFVLQSLHKVLPNTTLYYKDCTECFPVLLCTTKLAQSTPQYYFVLQSLHEARPSTTLYNKACTKHVPVLLCTTKLAQSTSLYYFVL